MFTENQYIHLLFWTLEVGATILWIFNASYMGLLLRRNPALTDVPKLALVVALLLLSVNYLIGMINQLPISDNARADIFKAEMWWFAIVSSPMLMLPSSRYNLRSCFALSVVWLLISIVYLLAVWQLPDEQGFKMDVLGLLATNSADSIALKIHVVWAVVGGSCTLMIAYHEWKTRWSGKLLDIVL